MSIADLERLEQGQHTSAQPRGALALVGIWRDVAEEELDTSSRTSMPAASGASAVRWSLRPDVPSGHRYSEQPAKADALHIAYGQAGHNLPEQQFTSSITLGELVFGAHRLGARGDALLERMDRALLPNLSVLPFDTEAARHYGSIRAGLERRGTPIGDADIRIAAIALAHGFTVVTGNVRHFQRVPGLSVENWLEE